MYLYFDCSNGISTDMVLMALLDLGANRDFVLGETEKLGLHKSPDEIIKSKETKPRVIIQKEASETSKIFWKTVVLKKI